MNARETTYETLTCPLPVIRKQWDEDGNDLALVVGVCGEEIGIEVGDSRYLYADGMNDTNCGEMWRVECHGGHVLLVPDHEADDNFNLIPYGKVAHAALVDLLERITAASGEVETPCATCGGTRRADWSSDDYVIPCPDCGVETPGWAEFFAERKRAGMGSFWLPPEIAREMPLGFICGMVCTCGPNLEPLACGYKHGHDGEHAWASLPTFVAGEAP